MNKSMMTGVVAVMFAAAMSMSGSASAQALGACGPANQGQVKSFAYYYPNGRLRQYYEFTCYDNAWENTAFWSCDSQGYCVNLS